MVGATVDEEDYLSAKIVGALGKSARKQEAKRKEDNGARTTQGNEQPPESAVVSTSSEAGRASAVHQGPESEGETFAVKAIEPEYKTHVEDVAWKRYADMQLTIQPPKICQPSHPQIHCQAFLTRLMSHVAHGLSTRPLEYFVLS